MACVSTKTNQSPAALAFLHTFSVIVATAREDLPAGRQARAVQSPFEPNGGAPASPRAAFSTPWANLDPHVTRGWRAMWTRRPRRVLQLLAPAYPSRVTFLDVRAAAARQRLTPYVGPAPVTLRFE